MKLRFIKTEKERQELKRYQDAVNKEVAVEKQGWIEFAKEFYFGKKGEYYV
jgi:hypothetical protein